VKSLLKITSLLLAIIIALGLTSCSDEDGIFVETEIITEEFDLTENTGTRTALGETSLVNCYFFSCGFDLPIALKSNTLLCGADLEIDSTGELQAERSIIVQSWLSEDGQFLEGETYLTEGVDIDPILGRSEPRFYTLQIAANSEELVLGSFNSTTPNNSQAENPLPISGSFLSVLETCETSIVSDISENYVPGRATIDSEIFTATNGLCNQVFFSQDTDSLISFFLLGREQEIDSDGNLIFESEDIDQVIFSNMEEEYRVDEFYQAWIMAEPQEILESQTITFEEAIELGEPIRIRYSYLSEFINVGEIFNENGDQIGEFNASVFPCQ
jgi:hypothetical protein